MAIQKITSGIIQDGAIAAADIVSVANTAISGNITSSQIAPDQTLNGNVSVTGTLSTPNTFGFKNRIINGGMVIDQRNAGAAISVNSAGFPVDRFYVAANVSGVISAQRSSTAPQGFTNSTSLTVTTARASIAAGDVYGYRQIIEGYNTADLGWGTANAQSVTLSFWVRSSITGTYSTSIFNAAFNRSYISTYTISVANTWEQKTITITGDTTGTWNTDNSASLNVYWDLGSGSTYYGTAGAWAAVGAVRTSGSTNWISTLGATFYITGVQLEKGSTATSFDFRDYGRELAMCQRYLPMYGFATDDQIGVGQCTGTTSWVIQIPHIVQPRVAPTGITTGAAANFNVINSVASGVAVSSISFSAGGLSGSRVTGAVASGLTAGNATILRSQNTSGFIQFTGCEL